MKSTYNPQEIEKKWQKKWQESKIYSPDLDKAGKPFYSLMMFPYPSAEGMHVGNMYAFTGADVYGRFMRMKGFDVFEPIGLDGFGIHSENYAMKVGRHPKEQAKLSEENFYRQLHEIGNSFDWTRTVETYKPEYYKWTQWIFIQLFKAGLAYKKKAPVNFCPKDLTVLADEQVIDGKCERCGSEVEKRELEQWFFRITKYAQRLLDNIEGLNWTEKVKIAQKNWIGRSEGSVLEFEIIGLDCQIKGNSTRVKVFTTRPDTLFGATFLVLSPENKILEGIDKKEVKEYIQKHQSISNKDTEKEKTGVFTGLFAINPVNKEKIPVWVSDYVLAGYGTGAIMAVPAHDQRDFEFAKKYDLPIVPVISPQSNVIFVHGCPSSKEDLIDMSEGSTAKYWMVAARKELRTLGYEAFIPLMPEPWNPSYLRWKEEFEKLSIDEETIIVATSCGGSFMVRWLSETNRKIKKLILVAPAKIASNKGDQRLHALEKLYDFEISSNVKNNVGEIIIVTSNDDPRHLESADLFEKELNAKRIKIENQGHFVVAEIPELIDLVTKFESAYTGSGKLINSNDWNGWEIPKDLGKVIDWLEKKGIGKREINFHLRDWLISRQRYWGPPIPMIYCEKCGWQPAAEEDLPVLLPDVKDWKPEGEGTSPLAKIPGFVNTTCPNCKGPAKRETDVSDTFLDSAWYFFRYISTEFENSAFDSERVKSWMPVNMYIGGAEHSVLHLLYSRFLTMVFKDLGLISFEEPYSRFYAHGLIIKEGAKMSKSKGNVIIPDAYIGKYGADALRMYLMFLGPFSQGGDFRDSGIEGMHRFLKRVWKLISENTNSKSDAEALQMMNRTIKKVSGDFEELRYNTAIAGLMEWYNFLAKRNEMSKEEAEAFLKLLAPFAPHMTEEIWSNFQNKESIHVASWPSFDEKFIEENEISIAVSINGKMRDVIKIESSKIKDQDFVEQLARESDKVKKYLENKRILKTIYVAGKVVNFVIG